MIGMGYCRIEEFLVKYLWAWFCRKPCPNSSDQQGVYRSLVLDTRIFINFIIEILKIRVIQSLKLWYKRNVTVFFLNMVTSFSFQQLKIEQYF